MYTSRVTSAVAAAVVGLVAILTTGVPAPPTGQSPTIATPLQPIQGATDVDLLRDIEWTPVTGVQAYYLYVGTVPGEKDLLNSGELQQTHYPAIGLPVGTLVYARLWTKADNLWRFVDFSFTTSTTAAFGFIYPPASLALADMTRPFEWTAVPSAETYYLYVGTTPGAKDIVNTGEIRQTSFLAFNLPQGIPLYVRIWAKVSGQWRFVDQVLTVTATARQLASFIHPGHGLSNANMTRPFQWSGALNAQAYYLYVGTTAGANDLVNSGETLATTYPSPTLPTGRPLYARLWTKTWGTWRYVDITFSVDPAAAGSGGVASFVYPTDHAVAVDITRQIQWTSLPNAQAYYLYVGTEPGLKNVIDSGEIQKTTYPAWSLPSTGLLYARLFTKTWGVWRSVDISFTAAPMGARIITPADGAINVDPTRTFTWSSVPSKQAYYLYVGSTPGAKDLIDSEETQQTSWSGLNGGKSQGLGQVWGRRTLYVRLWTKLSGVWTFTDASFTTQPLAARFVYPVDQSEDVDVATPFSWTSVPNARYRLTIDRESRRGRTDLLVDSGIITRTSFAVPTLPRRDDLHARIWTEVNGVWRYTDLTFSLEREKDRDRQRDEWRNKHGKDKERDDDKDKKDKEKDKDDKGSEGKDRLP